MQEKDIKRKLNQELDKMAPDILDRIIAQPINPVKNERELLGKNRPLFKEHKKIKSFLWIPISTAITVCLVILVLAMQPHTISDRQRSHAMNMAFNINIDVNPSINIDVNGDGTVKKVTAENKDAKEIVEKIQGKIDEKTNYNKVVSIVVKQLNKSGYLKNKKSGMLLSVVSKDKKAGKEKLNEIKYNTKQLEKKNKIKCTTVYQNCEVSDKIIRVAEKNSVSVGKAALCMKLAEKDNVSVKKMCKKTIDTLIKKAEQSGTEYVDEIIIDDGKFMEETESIFYETESYTEPESIEETTYTEDTTTSEDSNITVEVTTAGKLENETRQQETAQ